MMRYATVMMLLLAAVGRMEAQQREPVGEEAFTVVHSLFEYDTSLPLHSRTIQTFDTIPFKREKFVIDGWRGSRVPGLLAVPKAVQKPVPVILLVDGIGGWKERWWQHTSWNRGRVLIDSLIASGYAVVMIDAPASGERTYENDFETAESFIRKPPQYRDLILQNTIEHRRVVDYLATRADIDTARIGAAGLSLGGTMTFILGAVEPRIKAGVAGLSPLWRFGPVTSAATYASHVEIPMLMLMGRTDSFYTSEDVTQVYGLLGSKTKELVWYDVGHRLPEAYAGATTAWFRSHLGKKSDR